MEIEYKCVDMGLPSGTLWADRNIGATSTEDPGLYFQWGDTQGFPRNQYEGDGEMKRFDWCDYKFADCPWYSGDSIGELQYINFTKYGRDDRKNTLEAEDDAVVANMGGNWIMPTIEQYAELMWPMEMEDFSGTVHDLETLKTAVSYSHPYKTNEKNEFETRYTTIKYTKVSEREGADNRRAGLTITSKKTKNELFFPLTEFFCGGKFRKSTWLNFGLYWTSSLYPIDTGDAYSFQFFERFVSASHFSQMRLGIPIRGVCKSVC